MNKNKKEFLVSLKELMNERNIKIILSKKCSLGVQEVDCEDGVFVAVPNNFGEINSEDIDNG